jgi:hypothetical protein
MESEKLIYWLTLGMLAMATITGSLTGRVDRLADRSIAMMSQASGRVMNYAEIANIVLGNGDVDLTRSPRAVVAAQNSLACVQRVLVRRQAEVARLQAMRVQVQMLERAPRTMVLQRQNIVIEVPEPPQIQTDSF